MLQSLHIRHLLLIENLNIEFDAGLNIISGESGAGKSLVLYGIALLLGARFDHSLLSEGKSASVMGVWRLPPAHRLFDLLEGLGVSCATDEPVVVRRLLGSNSGLFVNDTPMSLRSLSTLAEDFAEMYGQFAAHRLQELDYQRDVLDDFASLLPLARDAKRLYAAWKQASADFAALHAEYEKLQQEAGYLEHTLEELDMLDMQEGEFDILTDRRRQVREMAARLSSFAEMQEMFRGRDQQTPMRVIEQIQSQLSNLEEDEATSELFETLERARIELIEAERSVDTLLSDAAMQENDLEAIEERLFRISELARKHRSTPEELLTVREELAAQINRLEEMQQEQHRLGEQVDGLYREMADVQSRLSKARTQAAWEFGTAVNGELPHLHLPKTAIEIELTRLSEPSAGGCERVQFLIRTQPDAPMRPLLKVVSGGELSRVLLAIALCLGQAETDMARVPLLFDEIDAGMGGETAAVLGGRMQRLAKTRQILAVTHSPQMAASAECHIVVQKTERDGHLFTQASRLTGEARREEIARMLAGETVTEAARLAAESLLKASSPKRSGGIR